MATFMELCSRLVPYWGTVAAASWVLAFYYVWMSDVAYASYIELIQPLFTGVKNEEAQEYGAGVALGFYTPMLIAGCVAALLLSPAKLPQWTWSWVNKAIASIRSFGKTEAEAGRSLAKKNQFALGQADFNVMAIWLVFLPYMISAFGYMPYSMKYGEATAIEHGLSITREKMVSASSICGWGSVLTLSFFLIPVTRHSVLLAAMGWSPIHALRLHIWSGYVSFVYAVVHALLLVIVWFAYDDIPVWKQIIPSSTCFGRNAVNDLDDDTAPPLEPQEDCRWQYWNLTGIVAGLFFFALWATSLNWFRRRWYRLFYIFHVVFGTGMILATVLHFSFTSLYFLPSIAYYGASTFPVLIQALASRFRKGVKILKVTRLMNAGGCVEIQFATTADSNAALDTEPCQFVKLCVPSISLVWHPFTVYKHPADPSNVRVLFRPVGPFTKRLADELTAPERPVTLVDGFYRGSDRVEQALQHDHVVIVCGGVAITPFLSVIPSLLVALAHCPSGHATRSLTLHWSCRESGLEHYVLHGYINDMIKVAKKINGFTLRVKIYQTGKLKVLTAADEALEMTEVLSISGELEEMDEMKRPNPSDMDDKFIEETGEATAVETASGAKGHAMELAHMLPGRFAELRWNLPMFVAFSGSVWIVFCLMFHFYDDSSTTYPQAAKMTWITMIVVAASFVLAVVVEGVVFALRPHWPSPKADTFVVQQVWVSDDIPLDAGDDCSNVAVMQGRPQISDLFEEARVAAAPGIFMCGPVGLTTMVWKEARKENSFFGLTRYCVYDEPFEM